MGNLNPLEDNDPMYKAGCSRCSVACILSNIRRIEINPYDVPVVFAYGYTNGAATNSDVLTYDTVYPKNYSNPDQQNIF